MNIGRRGIRSAFLAHSARASCRQGKSYKTREFCSLVTGDWIVENSNENVVILDCSNPVGFQRAHLPNAFNLPLAANGLKDTSFDPTGMISENDFTSIMQSLNIDNRHTLVFYDDQMSLFASRAWWLARYFGFPKEQLKVLDGGWSSWIHENRPVTNDQADPFKVRPHGIFKPQIQQHDVSINLRGLESHLEAQTAQIIDTRSKAEYVGLNASGNSRVGRVPGAFHFEWQEAINQKDNNKFLSKQELEKRIMTRFGLNKDKPTITYCQRGIRAAHTAFLLQELLGFKQVQVYEGSMMEYLNREDTKVEI